jgi:hypothetical protein
MERLEELVDRSRQGDVTAYAEIVEATQHMVLAVACQVLRDPSLAQDAAQDTYIRVFHRMREIVRGKLRTDSECLSAPPTSPRQLPRIFPQRLLNFCRDRN